MKTCQEELELILAPGCYEDEVPSRVETALRYLAAEIDKLREETQLDTRSMMLADLVAQPDKDDR